MILAAGCPPHQRLVQLGESFVAPWEWQLKEALGYGSFAIVYRPKLL